MLPRAQQSKAPTFFHLLIASVPRMPTMHRLSSSISSVLLSIVVVTTSLPVTRTAWAQQPGPGDDVVTPSTNADEDKRKGDEAMIALRYEEALTRYRSVFEATKNPALLYNMGRAYEGLGDFPKALDALEGFQEKAPADLKARVPKLQELIDDVRKRVSTMIVSSNVAGAEIRLGNKVIGKTKMGQTFLRVTAGAQTLTVTHPEYFPFERPITLPAGKIETVDVVLGSRAAEALLRVTSPVSGAAVSLDGKPIGNVPAEAPTKPGQHVIALRRDGYDPAETSVVVIAGETKEVNVPMGVRETITGKWWFWTGIGVILVGAGIATYLIATTEKDPDAGTIPPGTVKAESWGFRF
jgi:hypothetical protein